METFRKVTALVTRNFGAERELLTFLHPLAGRQLPAGSVEDGEDPAVAARREVWEETGVEALSPPKLLRVDVEESTDVGYLCSTQVLHDLPDRDDLALSQRRVRRGYRVSIEEQIESWIRISNRTYDFSADPPTLTNEMIGWVPSSTVARRLERLFFHFKAEDLGEVRSWTREADGHLFRIEWLPLIPCPRLVNGQQEWLDKCFEELVR
ncbi:NUDIX domain-containing protein [Inquilinus limosus]|uniref:NUDIX domain-containing protein n=1 Tax=Inquilinus limosus TaxID=171674 RepID=UPI003F166A7C